MIGAIVGGYRLAQKLGEGSMGEVFLGEHEQSRQKSAVKVLFPTFSKEGTALARYFAEVKSTNLFGHPCIAQVYDCGTHTSGRAFLCMEYLPGKSLAAALGDMEPVGEIAALANIGGQAASALQAVHAKRMVHRALKSDSIFLTSAAPYPVIKLLDFGVANFTQNVRHSQTGSLLGAPLYMSPEVGRGMGNVDHRADIYSLGCILFELATGRPPFVREGAGQLIIAHATEAAPAAKALEPSIPPALDDLIARCLRKDPAHRPQSMAEIAAHLARFSTAPAQAPVFAQANAPAVPQQVGPQQGVTAPHASLSAFLQRASAVSWAGVTPVPVQPPSAGTGAAAASPPGARRHEPTALLQPSEPATPAQSASLPTKPPTPKSPVARQPTALLDPPCQPVVIRETTRKRVSRSAPMPADEPAPSSRAVNVPLIVIAGVIVLCVVAIIVLLLMRKSASPSSDQTAPTPPRTAPREEFQPPSPPPQPVPDELAQPAVNRVPPARATANPENRTPRSKSPPPAERSAPTRAKEAPRW
jgi:serine/threonine protein kinase